MRVFGGAFVWCVCWVRVFGAFVWCVCLVCLFGACVWYVVLGRFYIASDFL